MKTFLFVIILTALTVSCSNRAKHVIYDSMHEYERQQCLKQGRDDCQRKESYDKYKQKREEEIKK